jgi:hypothetical protein
MKGYASKLHNELSIRPLKVNLLVLIMQLIVMSENFSVRAISARRDSPDKLANLNNSIWSKLTKLHLKFVKNVQQHRVQMYVKASSEKILKNNHLILIRDWNRFYARLLSTPFREKARRALDIQDAAFYNF